MQITEHRWTTEDGELAEITTGCDGEFSWSFPPGSVAAVLVCEVMRQVNAAPAARESAAAKVGAAGCLCLNEFGKVREGMRPVTSGRYETVTEGYLQSLAVDVHDPRCPVELARKIREGQP
jgi:hypothetical protein